MKIKIFCYIDLFSKLSFEEAILSSFEPYIKYRNSCVSIIFSHCSWSLCWDTGIYSSIKNCCDKQQPLRVLLKPRAHSYVLYLLSFSYQTVFFSLPNECLQNVYRQIYTLYFLVNYCWKKRDEKETPDPVLTFKEHLAWQLFCEKGTVIIPVCSRLCKGPEKQYASLKHVLGLRPDGGISLWPSCCFVVK